MSAKPEHFAVNVMVIEGRHLVWPNMDSAVHVRFDNQKKCTAVCRKTDAPFFNEFFVFETYTTLHDLLGKTVTLTVIQPRSFCKQKHILGYMIIDMAAIWNQPDHQFFHKWAIISAPSNDPTGGTRGYIKVDLSIVRKGEAPKIQSLDSRETDDIEGNLLLPEGVAMERQRAKYIFKIYRGENLCRTKYLQSGNLTTLDGDPPSCYVEVVYTGLKARTSTKKIASNPVWNESLILTELFPPLCHRIKINLCYTDVCLNQVAVHNINLSSISNEREHGFLPTFGPSFVHFYAKGSHVEGCVGRVLMSFNTDLDVAAIGVGQASKVEKAPPILEASLWRTSGVLLCGVIFNVTLLDKKHVGKSIRFEINFGNDEVPKKFMENKKQRYSTPPIQSKGQIYGHLDYGQQKPCVYLEVDLPDLRKRLYNSNLIVTIVEKMKIKLEKIRPTLMEEKLYRPEKETEQLLLEAIDVLSSSCRQYIDVASGQSVGLDTDLDKERRKLCIKEMEDIDHATKSICKPGMAKNCFIKLQELVERMDFLTEDAQDCWANVYITMISGSSKVAFYKYPVREIIYSAIEEEKGKSCGKIRDLFLQSLDKTATLTCKLEMSLWLGLEKHKDACFKTFPEGFKISTDGEGSLPYYLIAKEKVHIYQGKFVPGQDRSGLSDPFARVTVLNETRQTKVAHATLNPVWDQTLAFRDLVVYGARPHIEENAPLIVVEIFDHDFLQTEYIGRAAFRPHTKFFGEPYVQPKFPPKLRWHKVCSHEECLGEILATAEFLETSEMDEEGLQPSNEITPIPQEIKPTMVKYRMEVVFWGVRNLQKICQLSVSKPEVVLECGDAVLHSGTILNLSVSSNFKDELKSIDINLPKEEEYAPPLVIKLFDLRSFGRHTLVGTHIVPLKYFWYHPLDKPEWVKLFKADKRHRGESPTVRIIDIPKVFGHTTQKDQPTTILENYCCCFKCKRRKSPIKKKCKYKRSPKTSEDSSASETTQLIQTKKKYRCRKRGSSSSSSEGSRRCKICRTKHGSESSDTKRRRVCMRRSDSPSSGDARKFFSGMRDKGTHTGESSSSPELRETQRSSSTNTKASASPKKFKVKKTLFKETGTHSGSESSRKITDAFKKKSSESGSPSKKSKRKDAGSQSPSPSKQKLKPRRPRSRRRRSKGTQSPSTDRKQMRGSKSDSEVPGRSRSSDRKASESKQRTTKSDSESSKKSSPKKRKLCKKRSKSNTPRGKCKLFRSRPKSSYGKDTPGPGGDTKKKCFRRRSRSDSPKRCRLCRSRSKSDSPKRKCRLCRRSDSNSPRRKCKCKLKKRSTSGSGSPSDSSKGRCKLLRKRPKSESDSDTGRLPKSKGKCCRRRESSSRSSPRRKCLCRKRDSSSSGSPKRCRLFRKKSPSPESDDSEPKWRLCKKKHKKEKRRRGLWKRKKKTPHEEVLLPDETDWWSKYMLSTEMVPIVENKEDKPKICIMKIYASELESQPEFQGFKDMLQVFEMYKGKRTGDETIDEANITGIFKGAVRIYRWPQEQKVTEFGVPLDRGVFHHFAPNDRLPFVARVYCVKAFNLRPKDYSGKSDPYIVIHMGKKVVNDKEHKNVRQVNPVFGRCFELNGVLPHDHTVTISVWDWDAITSDDLIGETKINIENRFYTRHRAHCGLSYQFSKDGLCKWRDREKPSKILEHLCKKANIDLPVYGQNYVQIMYTKFYLEEPAEEPNVFDREALSLLALHHWQEVPLVGCELVPEHIETRSLYHPAKPGLEQGKLQLWVDIFPSTDVPLPPMVDITPRKPVAYELRVIIWNTEEVILQEDDFFVGEKMSDIYVKGWLSGPEEAQTTDVHYRSLTGEGNFNWRFVFRFQYISSENKIVKIQRESLFSMENEEVKLPCRLTLQVWENDKFSADDFLGTVGLELAHLPRGARSPKACGFNIFAPHAPTINLFKTKRTRGWWPLYGVDMKTKKSILAGKVEIELELIVAEEADKNPAGLGRSEPLALPKPLRPDTAFSCLKNPLRALKFLCKLHKWKIIKIVLITAIVVGFVLAVYHLPGYSIKKLFKM